VVIYQIMSPVHG